jgi:hypothetical protein
VRAAVFFAGGVWLELRRCRAYDSGVTVEFELLEFLVMDEKSDVSDGEVGCFRTGFRVFMAL